VDVAPLHSPDEIDKHGRPDVYGKLKHQARCRLVGESLDGGIVVKSVEQGRQSVADDGNRQDRDVRLARSGRQPDEETRNRRR
jgi:hypothetical protein